MIKNVHRVRVLVACCAAAAALPFQFVGAAEASSPRDFVALAETGAIAEDGTVTLSGTYRCAPGRQGAVFVSSKLIQADGGSGIGGSFADCDGRAHQWSNKGKPATAATPGAARGEATLLRMDTSRGLIPIPSILATDHRDLELADAT
ncbi:DUF6299 family protein [Yinghuangia soli]|uniref:DUF6299 family protein n=1 Tax=Yinghuangia soli TaxID=2908204 RepID=A0AA41Q3K1_9ACTN|nr:DUF6299 family protein [Yinghuangia soli]MCF2530345.1 DUF6299 family protein [Yinghuangia soli]